MSFLCYNLCMQKSQRAVKIFFIAIITFIILFLSRSIWIPRLYYIYSMHIARESPVTMIKPVPYQLPHNSENNHYITFGQLEVPELSGSVVEEVVKDDFLRKKYLNNNATSSLHLFSTSVSYNLLPELNNDSNSTEYSEAVKQWSLTRNDFSFWNINKGDILNLARLAMKSARLRGCKRLYTFENADHIKGLVCEGRLEMSSEITAFVTPNKSYDIWLFKVTQGEQGRVIAGLKKIEIQ